MIICFASPKPQFIRGVSIILNAYSKLYGIFQIAITISLPLFTLPLAGVDLSLDIADGDKKLLDVALLTWLAIALICFVIEEHVMCYCFVYLLRTKLKLRRREDNRDEPPPYSPVVIPGTYGFYQSLTPPCPQYAVVCSSTSGSTSWPTA
jgi:hypothetical protein